MQYFNPLRESPQCGVVESTRFLSYTSLPPCWRWFCCAQSKRDQGWFANIYQRNKEDLLKEVKVFGLTLLGDGATIHQMPLMNILAMSRVTPPITISIQDCTSHMAEGRKKDVSYIADLFGWFCCTQSKNIGGDLLDLNFANIYQRNKEDLLKEVKVFGLMLLGDGAAIHRMPLMSILAMSRVTPPITISIQDCTSHMAESEMKVLMALLGEYALVLVVSE